MKEDKLSIWLFRLIVVSIILLIAPTIIGDYRDANDHLEAASAQYVREGK